MNAEYILIKHSVHYSLVHVRPRDYKVFNSIEDQVIGRGLYKMNSGKIVRSTHISAKGQY